MHTPELSAGLLLFRRIPEHAGGPPTGTEVLIGHMGGPFWAHKAEGAWSIPKGHVNLDEGPFDAALREFREELGIAPPQPASAAWLDLGTVRQSSGKVVHVWALESDLDLRDVVPGTFDMEWPPRSGRTQSFPELDRVGWRSTAHASTLLVRAQREFLKRLPTPLARL